MVAMTAQRIEPEIEPMIELPSDGIITRADFEALPRVPRGWAWELRSGRLELTYMPVTFWHSRIVLLILMHWYRLGHEYATEQYVADSGFVRAGTGNNNFVADGVVFKRGYRPANTTATHEPSFVHAAIEAVSKDSEERDAVEKMRVYAQIGVPHYWIVRAETHSDELDGLISMYELTEREYKLVGTCRVSQLEGTDGAGE